MHCITKCVTKLADLSCEALHADLMFCCCGELFIIGEGLPGHTTPREPAFRQGRESFDHSPLIVFLPRVFHLCVPSECVVADVHAPDPGSLACSLTKLVKRTDFFSNIPAPTPDIRRVPIFFLTRSSARTLFAWLQENLRMHNAQRHHDSCRLRHDILIVNDWAERAAYQPCNQPSRQSFSV
jgi:hypothetical protein